MDNIIFDDYDTFNFLFQIIKNADDIDVGQFLENIKAGLIDRDVENYTTKSNKEFLLEYLYGESLFDNVDYRQIIFKHLQYIAKSYHSNSYYISKLAEEFEANFQREYVSENRLAIVCETEKNGKKKINAISFEDFFKYSNPLPEDFKKLFKQLVNIYTKYQFYFAVVENESKEQYIYKIIPLDNNDINSDIIHRYKIRTVKNKTSYLTNMQSGIEYSLHHILKSWYGTESRERGFDDYTNSVDCIVEVLTKEEPDCNWCNPKDNGTEEQHLCADCKILKKELINHKLDVNSIEEHIKAIKLQDCMNLADLRKKRKKEIKQCAKSQREGDISFNKNGNYQDNYNNFLIEIKDLLNNYFKTTINY